MQTPAKPCSGGKQLAQHRPGHFPHTRETLLRFNSPTHAQPLQLTAPARRGLGPKRGGLGASQPQPGWRPRLRKAWAAAAAPPRCPQPPAAYGDALLCRRPRQRSASSSRGVTSCSAPPAPPIGTAAAARSPSRLRRRGPCALTNGPRGPGPSRPGAGRGQGEEGRAKKAREGGEGGPGDGTRRPWLGRRGGSGSVLPSSPQYRRCLSRRNGCSRGARPGAADKRVCTQFWAAVPF